MISGQKMAQTIEGLEETTSDNDIERLPHLVEEFLSSQLSINTQDIGTEDTTTASTTTIFMVGDNSDNLISLSADLESYGNHMVIGRSRTVLEIVLSALNDCDPDIVIFDIGLCVTHHMRTIQLIRNMCPSAKIVVLSPDSVPLHIKQAQWCGAHGYIQKGTSVPEIIDAIADIQYCQDYFEKHLSLNAA